MVPQDDMLALARKSDGTVALPLEYISIPWSVLVGNASRSTSPAGMGTPSIQTSGLQRRPRILAPLPPARSGTELIPGTVRMSWLSERWLLRSI
jgi:hypothetical protein